MSSRLVKLCLTLALTLFVSACGESTIVRPATERAWDAPKIAIEEMAIGGLEGPEETWFANVGEMAPDASGGLYIFTGPPASLRYYDAGGRFVRQVGREGDGPGEYRGSSMGLEALRDGRLVLRDHHNGRFNVYNSDGSYSDTWLAPSGLGIARATTIDTLDHVYLKIVVGRPRGGGSYPIGLLHLDANGVVVDTIPPPQIEGDPNENVAGQFLPEKFWALSRYRQMIVGVSSEYRFEIRNPDGTVVQVGKEWTPIPLAGEEKSEWQAYQDWQHRFMPLEMKPLPDRKPAFQGIFAGIDGTIWVQLHVPAEKGRDVLELIGRNRTDRPRITWAEPPVFDVFEADGTYLGEVGIPPRTHIVVFSQTNLWGVRSGELDEHYAVRLRLEDS